jgi:hypothetical protein
MSVMTTKEILARLNAEFPNEHVSFTLEVSSFPGNTVYTDPEDPINIEMYLWSPRSGRVPCDSLDAGIAALKAVLRPAPDIDLEVRSQAGSKIISG